MRPASDSISVLSTATAGVSYTGYTGAFTGKFLGIHFSTLPATSEWLSSTARMKIEGDLSGIEYLTSDTPVGTGAWYWPRAPIHTDTGGLAGDLASTQSPLYDHFPVVSERIKLTIFDSSTIGQEATFSIYVAGTEW